MKVTITTGAPITISNNLSGKMGGVCGISTSTLKNAFCNAMRALNDPACICYRCYARAGLAFKKNVREAYAYNEILKNYVLNDIDIEIIAAAVAACGFRFLRFESHGEVENSTQLHNYFMIAEAVKKYGIKCALWFKNVQVMLEAYNSGYIKKPKNIKIVQSSPFINTPVAPCCDWVDVVFTVYNIEYIKNNFKTYDEAALFITCGAKNCAMCGTCYKQQKRGGVVYINEMLKSDINKYNDYKKRLYHEEMYKKGGLTMNKYSVLFNYNYDQYILINDNNNDKWFAYDDNTGRTIETGVNGADLLDFINDSYIYDLLVNVENIDTARGALLAAAESKTFENINFIKDLILQLEALKG